MARDMTPAQKIALGEVRSARKAQKDHKVSRRAELMEKLRQEGFQLEMTVALAVRKAQQLGVSIAAIGREGLGTTDPGTPRRLLAMTDPELGAVTEGAVFSWLDDEHTVIKVAMPGFVDEWDHVELDAMNWPDVLSGTVRRDPEGADDTKRRSGWLVVRDDQGIGQWFTKMIEGRSGTGKQGDTLPVLIERWAGENP